MSSGRTVMASLPRSVLELAAVVGLDAASLATTPGLSPTALTDPDGRVSIDSYRLLYERVANEPSMWEGMRLVLGIDNLAPLGVLGYVLANSRTVVEAFSAYERHAAVIGEVFGFHVQRSNEAFVLRFRVPHELQRFALFNVGTVALNTSVVRILTGQASLPRIVELPCPRDEHLVDPATMIPATFRYGGKDTALYFDPEIAAMPVRSSDPTLFYFVERHARSLRDALAHPTTWSARTREALLERLRGEPPSLEQIARALGTSGRTLARRLQEEDCSFKDVLEETRRDLALAYVRDRQLPLAEVAFLLGYADVPSFHKAFRRWTGQTPGDARRSVAA